MAFKGDLRNVQLADLLQTLAQNRQEGVLTVTSALGTHRVVLSRSGVSLLDPAILGRRRIGEILQLAGVVSDSDLASALREQARHRKFLGEVLVASGKVPQETLDRVLAIQVDEELYELFRSSGGTFEFAECDVPSLLRRNHHSVRPLAVEQVVLEAARRMDEWSQIERLVPSIDGLYLADCTPDSVTDEAERAVLARLDGRHTVRDVADSLLDSPFAVAKVLADLIQQHRARPASREELFLTARELLTEGQKPRALRLLHRLAQLSPEPCPLDSQLAEMFKLAGDPRAAALVRHKVAEAARGAGRFDVARRELEAGLNESPGAIPLLHSLTSVLRHLKDRDAELARSRELASLLSDGGNTDDALAVMERLLELAPDDADARRAYSDLCLRAHLREKAIEVLEKDAARLKREGRVAELPVVYKRILAIDAGRKDVKRALAAVTRTRAERLFRSAGVLTAACAVLLLAGIVGWRSRSRARDLARVDEASAMLDAGDPEGARDLLADLLAADPAPEVTQPALRLMDRIDDAIAATHRARRSSRDELLSTRLTAIQQRIDGRQYDVALEDAVALLREQQEPYLADRVRTRLQALTQEFLARVSRAKETTAAFRMPTRDAEIAPAWQRMDGSFPLELTTAAGRLREIAFESAAHLEGAARDWMHELVSAADLYVKLAERMQPELAVLRSQHERLERLQTLSERYVEAARAAEAGDVERSRELLRKVLDEYGDGELARVFQERIEQLDAASSALLRVDQLIASGDLEAANAEARAAATQFKKLDIRSMQTIPVGLDTLPRGARVCVEGRDAGATPMVLRLPAGSSLQVELTLPGRASQRAAISAEGPARCLVELPRRVLAAGRLDAPAAAPPVFTADRFVVAARNGALVACSAAADGTLDVQRIEGTALSGALAPPLAIEGGFIAALWDGRVVRADFVGGRLAERWGVPVAGELPFTPSECADQVVILSAAGELRWLALESGEVAATLSLDARVVAAPLRLGTRWLIPLSGRELVAVDLSSRRIEWRRPLGHDLLHGLAGDADIACAPTSTGHLLILDPRDGRERGAVSLCDSAVAPARMADGIADVPLARHVQRVDLRNALVIATWRDLGATTTPALIDGRLWVPCGAGVVQVVDPSTGEPYERARLGTGEFAGPPVATETGVALLSRDGSFALFER
jgi:tetratricopeptide (TPR) repeat protein